VKIFLDTGSVRDIEPMFTHPLTDTGLEPFLKDWEQARADRG
jgi:hypothetical protein